MLLGALCGPLGVWVLLLRHSYAAESVAHAMLPGLVAASLLGLPIALGALGGVIAVLALAVLKLALVDPLAADFALIASPETMDFRLLVVVLLGAAIAVSALGSGLSLRRFLRV